MIAFVRDKLPDPVSFYEAEGLTLVGPTHWKTTRCEFHGGSDSLRINTASGGFKCMACQVSGGDVLSYYMQRHGIDFMDAAEALGATEDDGRQTKPRQKTTLSASASLALVQHETWLIVCTALAAVGFLTDERDRKRLIEASLAIQHVMEGAD